MQQLDSIPIISQGGNVLGNGTWLNVGGNIAVQYGGVQAQSQTGGGPYDDPDGGNSYGPPMFILFKRPNFLLLAFGLYMVWFFGPTCHSYLFSLLNPCDDGTCDWVMDSPMSTRRWYPTL